MVRGGWRSTSRGGGGGAGGGDECVCEKEIVQLSDGIYGPWYFSNAGIGEWMLGCDGHTVGNVGRYVGNISFCY